MRPLKTFTVRPALPPELSRLEELANNLWWSWHQDAIELFARAATLSRAQKAVTAHGLDASEHELSLCGIFCVESGRRFRVNRDALDAREEDLDRHRRKAYWSRCSSPDP